MGRLLDLWRRLRPHGADCPQCGNRAQDAHCEVCGYELVRQARARDSRPHPHG